jgi:putative ABC transport system substrate-binding protein
MGLQIQIYKASSSAEISAAFGAMTRERPDALLISTGPYFGTRRVQLANLASRHAIPTISGGRLHPEAGGLIGYGTDRLSRFRQTGIYVGRILKGAKPADLPIVQSTKFELVINAETARMLGISVPPSLLAIADEVIE